MEENPIENTELQNAVEETITQTVEDVPQKPKRTRAKKTVQDDPPTETEVEVKMPNPELEELKSQLAAMQAEKAKLEEEKTSLSEQISKLQEEVKITPQKLGQAIKEMGIAPLSVTREKPAVMSMEAYTNMSDSERQKWRVTNRSDYLNMLHQVKM